MNTDYLSIHNDDLSYAGETLYGAPIMHWNTQDTEKRNLADDGRRIAAARLYEESHEQPHTS